MRQSRLRACLALLPFTRNHRESKPLPQPLFRGVVCKVARLAHDDGEAEVTEPGDGLNERPHRQRLGQHAHPLFDLRAVLVPRIAALSGQEDDRRAGREGTGS